MFGKKKKIQISPEFSGGMDWINSQPLTMKSLRGKIVLINIWTYSNKDCQRALPYINEWYRKYSKKGLVIIGVHKPEFTFEKVKSNVEHAIGTAGIKYPVVLDTESKISSQLNNQWSPRQLLVNTYGNVVYDNIDVGGYIETEQAIQDLLLSSGERVRMNLISNELNEKKCTPATLETFLGYGRGVIANRNELDKDHFHNYKKRSSSRLPLLEGDWKVTREYVESNGGVLHFPYTAKEVNGVVELSENMAFASIPIHRDGRFIPRNDLGNDLQYVNKGTVLCISEPRMYNLVMSSSHHSAMLTLYVPSGVRIHAISCSDAF